MPRYLTSQSWNLSG